jgi:hypothetical protein
VYIVATGLVTVRRVSIYTYNYYDKSILYHRTDNPRHNRTAAVSPNDATVTPSYGVSVSLLMISIQYQLLNEQVTTALASSLKWYLLLGLFTAGILPISKKLKH